MCGMGQCQARATLILPQLRMIPNGTQLFVAATQLSLLLLLMMMSWLSFSPTHVLVFWMSRVPRLFCSSFSLVCRYRAFFFPFFYSMADPSYPFINISSSSSSSSTTYDRHSTIQQQQSQSLVSLEEYGLSSHITSTPNFDNTTQDITQQPPCDISSEPSFAYRDEDEDEDCHHPTASPTLMENDHSRFGYMESSQQYGNTVAGYRSNSMKLKRSDRVRAMMGAVPIDMPRLFPSNPNTTLYSSR